VILTYGLATDPLRSAGITSAETIGTFIVAGGQVQRIIARFTPVSEAAVRSSLQPAAP
jgi:hypothetical protein